MDCALQRGDAMRSFMFVLSSGIALFIIVISTSCNKSLINENMQNKAGISHEQKDTSPARDELSLWLASEGFKMVRAARFREADDIASLIDFLSGNEVSLFIKAEIQKANAKRDYMMKKIAGDSLNLNNQNTLNDQEKK